MTVFPLPKTNIFAPKNGWLEDDSFPFGMALFLGAKTLVSESVMTKKISGISCNQLKARPKFRDEFWGESVLVSTGAGVQWSETWFP